MTKMAVLRGLKTRLLLIASIGGIVAIYFIFKGFEVTPNEDYVGPEFLAQVMTASGGKENYKNIERITFKKNVKLYGEDGAIELDRSELHSYDYTRDTNRIIQWKEDGEVFNLIEKDTALFRTKNSVLDTTITRESLQSNLDAATFVLGLPFTLDTDSSTKVYKGITSFESQEAHELEVRFADSDDIWKLYYSPENLTWLGYWVKTSDHYSVVINNEMMDVKGMTFPRKRKSYRTDSLKSKEYLRAEYLYSNFEIK